MQFYETLYIVDSNLENKSLEKTMKDIGKKLEETKSKIINHRIWGKKRLAYPIQRQKYGSYIIMQYEIGDQKKMVDYDVWLKLNNEVLRHMTVSLKEKPEVSVDEGNAESDNKEVVLSSNKQEENGVAIEKTVDEILPDSSENKNNENEELEKEENSDKEEVKA